MAEGNPITHLTSPIVTGSTVIGIKFDKGVILACDTMLSYGGLLSNFYIMKSTRRLKDSLRSKII